MHRKPRQTSLKISPQVLLFEIGAQPSAMQGGWIGLPQYAGSVFGDGTHPTTQLCAGALDFICRLEKPLSVLDVGTGTGVLARIARARGVQFVAGTDIDPAALISAQRNGALDLQSSELLLLNVPPDHWGPCFNLVVANILERPLRELAQKLTQALAPGGVLLISGFTQLQISGLRLTFTDLGLTYVNDSHLDGWALLMFRA
jgi:ribosomal protein L11 methyltransferase